jgi:hypothetical protein
MDVRDGDLELDRFFHDETTDIYSYCCEGRVSIRGNEYDDAWIEVTWTDNKVEVWFQRPDEIEGYGQAELLGTVNNLQLQFTFPTVPTVPPPATPLPTTVSSTEQV